MTTSELRRIERAAQYAWALDNINTAIAVGLPFGTVEEALCNQIQHDLRKLLAEVRKATD